MRAAASASERSTSFIGDPVVKLLAQHDEMEPEAFWANVHSAVGDLVTTTWSSEHAMVEISAHGVTKASTLASLAADLGLGPEDVLAFGDMPNDIAMLEWAGLSYAMANAHPLALDAASHRAGTNDEDGVARVLEVIFANIHPVTCSDTTAPAKVASYAADAVSLGACAR